MFDEKFEDISTVVAGFQVESQLPAVAPEYNLPATSFGEQVVVAQRMGRDQRRDIESFTQRMKVLASMAGESYRYSFPVKTKGGGSKTIEGPSIALANDLVREYGNCRVIPYVQDQGGYYIFYATFVDYETGFSMTRAYRQRKGQVTMKTDSERQEDIVFQIGQSKAIRNVVVNALGTFVDFVYEEARQSLVNKIGKNLAAWHTKISDGCIQKGYDISRIERAVGRPLGDWLATDVARVIAELKSVGDGMTSFDDLYPLPEKEKEDDSLIAEKLREAMGAKKQEAEAIKEWEAISTELETAGQAEEVANLIISQVKAGRAKSEALAAAGGGVFMNALLSHGLKEKRDELLSL